MVFTGEPFISWERVFPGWLDSLSEIAENEGWEKKRKEDLNKIKILSERLVDGVEEKGLNLSHLHIPGLSRYYIRRLVGAGYCDEKCLKGASEGELGEVLPRRLVDRIQKRIKEERVIQEVKKQKLITCKGNLETENLPLETRNLHPESASSPLQLETRNPKPVTILEIDTHRPDRIIFEGKEIKVTATEFSLAHLLAQHRGKILIHNDLLDTIWKKNEYATYTQITYHLYKIRRVILKTIGNNKKNKEKVKDILKDLVHEISFMK
jgi:helicase